MEYQVKFKLALAKTEELNSDFRRLESELALSRSVNSKLCDTVTSLQRHCWNNNPYTRWECLRITGLPDSEKGSLEDLTLEALNKTDLNIDSTNVKDCD